MLTAQLHLQTVVSMWGKQSCCRYNQEYLHTHVLPLKTSFFFFNPSSLILIVSTATMTLVLIKKPGKGACPPYRLYHLGWRRGWVMQSSAQKWTPSDVCNASPTCTSCLEYWLRWDGRTECPELPGEEYWWKSTVRCLSTSTSSRPTLTSIIPVSVDIAKTLPGYPDRARRSSCCIVLLCAAALFVFIFLCFVIF